MMLNSIFVHTIDMYTRVCRHNQILDKVQQNDSCMLIIVNIICCFRPGGTGLDYLDLSEPIILNL